MTIRATAITSMTVVPIQALIDAAEIFHAFESPYQPKIAFEATT